MLFQNLQMTVNLLFLHNLANGNNSFIQFYNVSIHPLVYENKDYKKKIKYSNVLIFYNLLTNHTEEFIFTNLVGFLPYS